MKRSRRAFGTVFERGTTRGVSVRFRWRGREYVRSGGPNRSGAEAKLAKAHSLLSAGAGIEGVLATVFGDLRGSRLTFRDAVPLYLEYAKQRKKVSTFSGDVRRFRVLMSAPWAASFLSLVGTDQLQRWAQERVAGGVSGATVNRDLCLASALYTWAVRARYCDNNPVKQVEKYSERGRARETYLTGAEARGLVDACGAVLRPVVMTALSTGMRRGELLALRWHDIDLDRGTLFVRPENEKAGRGRVVPMTPDLRALYGNLARARQERKIDGSDPVFVGNDGSALGESGLRFLLDATVARCEAIPVEKRIKTTMHVLRHTAASLMTAAGVPLFDVAKILGHSTLAVTMRYAHFAPEAGRTAVDRLGSALAFGDRKEDPKTTVSNTGT